MYHVMFSLYGKAWILHWKCSSESPATPPTDIITYRAQCYPGQSNRNVDHTLSITTTWEISHYQFIADYDYAHKLSAVHQLHWQCPHPMLVHHVAELVLQCNPDSQWIQPPPPSQWCNGHPNWAMLESIQHAQGQGAASCMWSHWANKECHTVIMHRATYNCWSILMLSTLFVEDAQHWHMAEIQACENAAVEDI